MPDPLPTLAERQAVIDTLTDLFIGYDTGDWDLVRERFGPEVLLDVSSMTGDPAAMVDTEDLIEMWAEGLSKLDASHHEATNYRVTVEGDEALATCYGTSYHYLENPTGRNTRTFVGDYVFNLSRERGAWSVHGFRYNLKFIDGNPDLEGAVEGGEAGS